MSNVYRMLFNYAREHRWATVFFILFGVFWAFTLPYMSYLFGQIVDEIKVHGLESVSISKLVAVPLCLYIVIHVLRSMGYYLHGLLSLITIPAYKSSMIKQLFNHLGQQSIAYFEEKRSGFLSNKVTNACISLEPIFFNFFGIIFPQSLAIILTGILLSAVVPYFGFILWLWGIVIIVYTFRTAKIGHEKASQFADACSQFNGHFVDVVNNIPAVIHNANIAKKSELLDQNLQVLVDKERIRNRHANKVRFIQFLAMNAIVAFFLIGSVLGYERGLVSVGDVVFVMTAVTAIAGLTSSLGSCFLEFIYNIGLLKEGLSLFEDHPDVPEHEKAREYSIARGEIEVRDLTFGYPGLTPIFQQFNFKVVAREKVGIVGSSGAGKTTLIKLLMRLYDVSSGSICIDGHDIRDYSKYSLRSQMAVVSQHLNLFHRSIYDNIAYGCGDVSKEAVIDAAKKAKCHEFIMNFEQQYDTVIGEQGVKLSGGQRQRIAIARATLKNAPVLLLDEATSALDSVTEQAIQDALDSLIADKTAIVIAHRLSTLKTMDRIIVLEGGQLIEMGTHDELLQKKGAYYDYWSHQSDGFIH